MLIIRLMYAPVRADICARESRNRLYAVSTWWKISFIVFFTVNISTYCLSTVSTDSVVLSISSNTLKTQIISVALKVKVKKTFLFKCMHFVFTNSIFPRKKLKMMWQLFHGYMVLLSFFWKCKYEEQQKVH